MDYSSSTSRYTDSNTNHLHDRCLYERHPRHDSAHRATRASTRDQVSGASDYLNELNDPLGLGSSVGTTSASFPSTALFSYSQADVKGMSMSTPHTRPMQALEPPPEDGTIYLHLPQYGGFPNNTSWSHMQYVSSVSQLGLWLTPLRRQNIPVALWCTRLDTLWPLQHPAALKPVSSQHLLLCTILIHFIAPSPTSHHQT